MDKRGSCFNISDTSVSFWPYFYLKNDKPYSLLYFSADVLCNRLKQHETVEYIGCQLDSKLSWEAMASKSFKKIIAKWKFLYRHSRCLTPTYRRLLCNALILQHFDYGRSSWFSLFLKKIKSRTSKSSTKKMYLLLPKFTSEVSYQSITL